MKLTICGGGNGAHTLAGVTSMVSEMEVQVLDLYQDESERWTRSMSKHGFRVNFQNQRVLFQEPDQVRFSVTKNIKVVENSDIVIICVPAYTHDLYLKTVVQYLPDACCVVGMPGQPGFEYQCLWYLQKYKKSCNIMSLETLPWACRIIQYGKEVMVVGTKEKVQISFVKRNSADAEFAIKNLQRALGKYPVLQPLPHILSLTLATKASIHPPIMYARWKDWDGLPLEAPPLFYQGVDRDAASILDLVTNEINTISAVIKTKFQHLDFSSLTSMNGWLKEHYGDQIVDNTSLLTSLQTNKAYNGLKHPMLTTEAGTYLPDFNYRYLSEDVPYGIVVLKAIAELVAVETPEMDKIIQWAQTKLEREYLVDGKISLKDSSFTRLPQTFGINSIETMVKMFE